MYNSPIELLITEVTNQIIKEQDEAIFKSVLNYVPNVDRAELLRALRYDRNQYEKGYADGKADSMAELVRCKECKYFDKLFKEEGAINKIGTCCLRKAEGIETVQKCDDFCSHGERK